MRLDCCARRYRPCSRATNKRAASFDYLIGGYQHRLGDGDAEHPGSLMVDDKREFV
jgi:hypothetical protein